MGETLFRALLIAMLCLQSGVSFAQLSNPQLDALRSTLDQLDYINPVGAHELECDVGTPDQVIHLFSFDGSMGYCPRYFFINQPTDSSESWMDKLSGTIVTDTNKELISSIKQLLQNEDQFHNCHLVQNILAYPDGKRRTVGPTVKLHYYSKSGQSKASECLSKVMKTGTPKIDVISYSMGGDSALQFINQNPFTQFERVVTVDPVGKAARWYTGVLMTDDQKYFLRPSNVVQWNNFFQKLDHRSLSRVERLPLGIRGSRVEGADSNLELTALDFPSEPKTQFEHVKIIRTEAVQQAISELVTGR